MLRLTLNFRQSAIHLCIPRMNIKTTPDSNIEADMILASEDDALRLRDWLTAQLPAETPKTVEERYRGYMSDRPRRDGYSHGV